MSRQESQDIEVLRHDGGTVWYEAELLDIDTVSSMLSLYVRT